jgi:hypothetical protein
MFRIRWDFGGVVYLLPNGSIEYDTNDRVTVRQLTTAEHRALMTKGAFYGEVDKVVGAEKMMVYLAWGPQLRALGVIE